MPWQVGATGCPGGARAAIMGALSFLRTRNIVSAAITEESIECLVVGAGVSGLATALALLDDGR